MWQGWFFHIPSFSTLLGLAKKNWYHLVYRFLGVVVIWKKPKDLEDEKKLATKKTDYQNKKKKLKLQIYQHYIYIYTTYGTLGNTYPPRLINTWWRMARNGALPPSSDGSPGMVLQHRLDTGRCCRRNNWQPPKWQFRKLACLWKKVHQNTKKENYISCIYIYSVMAACVYIYTYVYIYTVLSSNSSIFLGDFTNYRVVAYSFSTPAGCMIAVLVCLRAPSGFYTTFQQMLKGFVIRCKIVKKWIAFSALIVGGNERDQLQGSVGVDSDQKNMLYSRCSGVTGETVLTVTPPEVVGP